MAGHCKLDGFCCLTFARNLTLAAGIVLLLRSGLKAVTFIGHIQTTFLTVNGTPGRREATNDGDDRSRQVLNYGNYHSGEAQNTQHSYSSGYGDAQFMANYTPYHGYANPSMTPQGGNTTSMLSSSVNVPLAHSKHPQVAQTDPAGMNAELPYHLNNPSLGYGYSTNGYDQPQEMSARNPMEPNPGPGTSAGPQCYSNTAGLDYGQSLAGSYTNYNQPDPMSGWNPAANNLMSGVNPTSTAYGFRVEVDLVAAGSKPTGRASASPSVRRAKPQYRRALRWT
ncbi:hypothetical protein FB45DRAFT_877351 [Roridomyces roridus]|uniref:Uncharacterized protein n=1 Tax=Roridomyces roridus TaxID=1738132 RepID=A0AAD7B2T1_9AGAR|nr:hypothetical protein FB45DRAFT_877351 [Roridomyces roridus]